MKIDKLKVYALQFIILIVLFFTLFVLNSNSRIYIAWELFILTIGASVLLKKRKNKSLYSNRVTVFLLVFAMIYLIAFYLMGLYFGYYDATITLSFWSIKEYIIPIAIIIITSEILRNILLAQNTKGVKTITFIIMVLIDVLVYVDIYNLLSGYDNFIETIGFTVFASIACNLLYNYISIRYGTHGNILYRFITVLYVYFIPIIPNVYVFFRSILRIVFPYIIYQVIEYSFEIDKNTIAVEDKTKKILFKIIFGIIIVVIAMLISCKFRYGVLVVGSGSMTGTINKGDAVFFERFEDNDLIEESDVLIFLKKDLKVVHRVVDISNVNGEVRYVTKGDANQEIDEGYLTKSDIIGIVKFKIKYIGYPSLWIRDMFVKL